MVRLGRSGDGGDDTCGDGGDGSDSQASVDQPWCPGLPQHSRRQWFAQMLYCIALPSLVHVQSGSLLLTETLVPDVVSIVEEDFR